MIIVKEEFSILPKYLVEFIANDHDIEVKKIVEMFNCSWFIAKKIKTAIHYNTDQEHKIYSSIYEYIKDKNPKPNSLEFLSKIDFAMPEAKNCYLLESYDTNIKEVKFIVLLCEAQGKYFVKEGKFVKQVKSLVEVEY